ncbi:dephospho-CoA kinase [uncultured Azohydromonas sp.]|mgnify:CR=1 FL=1|jgi:dephospho-CoA kinase|uniref:dephospho-CoA kinase n=1 Tax=uncultured Azohydromonas sp. TaxID=487342 RepID=UPI002618ADF3|nr:dephospho-CoA kinase [uncultured Azohydromonas sp.]
MTTTSTSPATTTATPLRIGLTGGIGSGKSTVAAMLAELGAVVLDTDAISRELTAPGGAALPAIAALFGAQAIGADGALDRAWMRQRVFADAVARQQLEGILHPMIGAEVQRRSEAAGDAPRVFDVPLLTESLHWRARVQRVLVVDCSEQTQVQRVMQRSQWSEDTVRRVIAQQAPRARRRAIADAVLFNEGLSLEALALQVQALWRGWCPAA